MENLYDNTILIVDDTPENIDILVALLEDFNKKIAINGEDALETAFETPHPDLILLDIMMPEMDGYEVCQRLRADERTKHIPVIFLTAKTQQEDIIKGFEVGGQDYITKPFDMVELIERVRTQLELKNQREILKDMNVVLEQKVQERTVQLQEALEKLDLANKELQGLDNAKNTFLNMISHEIRTPLNGIAGAANLLKDFMDEDNELSEFVDMLKESADRLEHFSTTALIITQLQAENYKAVRDALQLNEVINTSCQKLEHHISENKVEISVDIPEPDLTIDVEKELFDRALVSIIHNAVKYSPQNGLVNIKAISQEQHAIIEISDQGKGFSEEALDSLFKPFGIGETHYDQNVGLSLKAAKMIMQAHDGDIWINNKIDSGAVVQLVFNNKGKQQN